MTKADIQVNFIRRKYQEVEQGMEQRFRPKIISNKEKKQGN
jgi:hypothetical protein